MAIKALNSIGGFSVGDTPANIILANGDITTINFTSNGVANLGNVGNVKITGGTGGYVLTTDGAGNLTWGATGSPSSIHNENSNVSIPLANSNVYINANSGVNQQWAFGTDGNLILPVGGVISEGTSPAGVGNTITLTPNGGTNVNQQLLIYPTITEGDHLHLTTGNLLQTSLFLGNDTQYIRTNTDGSMVIGTNDSQPDTPNLGYRWVFDVAGNLTAPSAGTANLGNLVTANFANFTNDLVVQGNIANANNITVTNNITSDTANVTGNLTAGNVDGGNLVKANNFATNGTGGDITLTGGNVQGANVTFSNSFTANSGVVDFTTSSNVSLGPVANIHITGGSSGYLLTTDGSGGLSWTATASTTSISNGDSNVTIPDLNGNVYINANGAEQWVFDTTGNLTGPATGTANLGNLVIANYANFANDVVVQGNISNANNISVTNSIAAGSANITNDLVVQGNIANANNISVTNSIAAGSANITNDLVVQGNIANANNISVTNNITAGSANVTNDLDVGGNIVTGTGSGGNISGVNYITANVANITNVVNTGVIANGTSNIRLATDSNVTISVNGTSNVFTFNDLGANVIGYIQANGVISAGGFEGSNLVSNVGILSLQAKQTGGTYNINLLAGGAGNIDVGNTYITSLKNPANPQDAATKEYVDNISQGLFVHAPANVLTSSNLTATYLNGGTALTVDSITGGTTITFTGNHGLVPDDDIEFTNSFNGIIAGEGYFVYSAPTLDSITIKNGFFGVQITTLTNGTSLAEPALGNGGVGATLTNSGANIALTIDSILMTVGKRVLVTGQTSQLENGIYDVTTVGNGATPWVLTRSSDGDSYQPKSSTALCNGSYFFISQGTTYAGSSYLLTSPTGEIHIGTDSIVFTQFSAAGAYTAGSGIDITGTVISANVDNVTTAIIGGNIAVKDGAQLNYPNIGAATGTSLDLTGNIIAGNVNSNAAVTGVDATFSGNITTTGAQGNIQGANTIFSDSFVSNGGLVDFDTNSANVQLGSNTNVHLYGGSSGQVLITDGSGALSWTSTPNISIIQNGTSNVTIPDTNGNVYINATSGEQWAFGTNGELSFPVTDGSIKIQRYGMGNLAASGTTLGEYNGTNYGTQGIIINPGLEGNTQLTLPGDTGAVTNPVELNNYSIGNVRIRSNAYYWNFDSTGNTQFPTIGTVDLGNVATANTVSVTNVNVGNSIITAQTTTTNSTGANQTIAQFTVTSTDVVGVEFFVKGVEALGFKYSVATVQAVTNGIDVDYAIYGGVRLGGTTGSLAVNMTSATSGVYEISLQATPASSNATVWTTQIRLV